MTVTGFERQPTLRRLDVKVIRARLEASPRLPSLRTIDSALRELLNADQRYTQQIADIIRRDPSLTARLLRLVNSVYYGLSIPVNNLEEAGRLAPAAIAAVRPDGLLWMAYPKGTSKVKTDVNRDRLWEATNPTGWRPVRQVALDDVWSAMRFRPADQVGK